MMGRASDGTPIINDEDKCLLLTRISRETSYVGVATCTDNDDWGNPQTAYFITVRMPGEQPAVLWTEDDVLNFIAAHPRARGGRRRSVP